MPDLVTPRLRRWEVLGAVETVLKRGKPDFNARYFDGAIKDAHGKAPAPSLQIVSKKVFVVHGTDAWTCGSRFRRGTRVADAKRRDENGRIQTGWDFEAEFPQALTISASISRTQDEDGHDHAEKTIPVDRRRLPAAMEARRND